MNDKSEFDAPFFGSSYLPVQFVLYLVLLESTGLWMHSFSFSYTSNVYWHT